MLHNEARKLLIQALEKTPEKLVFLDESGININMTRGYARSKGGSRAVDAVPLWKPQNITV